MILATLLSKEKISLCLFDPDKPLEPQFYTTTLDKGFLIDKSIPVLTKESLAEMMKRGFDLMSFKGDVYISSIDPSINIPEIKNFKIVDMDDMVMGFNYVLLSFDSDFVRQYECRFEDDWSEILTHINYGEALSNALVEKIDKTIIEETLSGVVENNFFVFANPYNNVTDENLSDYLENILKNIPQFNSKSRLVQINYDQNLTYFAFSIALNMAGVDPYSFYKKNPLQADVNIFNLKGLKSYKVKKDEKNIEDNIKDNKISIVSTKREELIKFSSSSFKAEVEGSLLSLFDNRS